MITTLENLPNVYKKSNIEKMASWIIKYQNFSTKAALKYAPEGYTLASLKNYFSKGLSYMNKNLKDKRYNSLYDKMDVYMRAHLQPLTPSNDEVRRVIKRGYHHKEATPPIATMTLVKKPISVKVIYGVQLEDTIKIFDSEDAANWFNKGIEYVKGIAGKVVTVELGEP